MVATDDIISLHNRYLTKILDAAEAAIPAERFPAFRRIALREFGKEEFELELKRLFTGQGPRT